MCGISYLYNKALKQDQIFNLIKESLDLLYHRGPDDGNIATDNEFGIGHRRLSIIDLNNSSQPMSSPDKRFFLSFNGEIYNYKSLRLELQSQWDFKTTGDTETLLAGLILYGESFVNKLQGMWAFIFWDSFEKELFLSRDRFGKKPIYYISPNNNSIFVSSEIPALKKLHPEYSFKEDIDSTADLFRYGFYMPGRTIYESVSELLPSQNLIWKYGNKPKIYKYWQLKPNNFIGSRADAIEQCRSLVKSSIEKRLTSDVEVGALLSGGVDSSIIVSSLVKDFSLRPKTYTIGFKDKSFDESLHAKRIATFLNIENELYTINDFYEYDLNNILSNIGQPFGDASILPMALVSHMASKNLKVALTGDGADEVFSGYQRYQGRIMLKWLSNLPKDLQKVLTNSIKKLPVLHNHHSRSIVKKAQLFSDLMVNYQLNPQYIAPRLLAIKDEMRFFPSLFNSGHNFNFEPETTHSDDIIQMMLNDINIYLPQDILLKSDRASMAHSLELRSPFLDRELVEFSFSIPREWHRNFGKGKRLLKSAFFDYLPIETWEKRKQGFSLPVSNWFMGKMGNDFIDLVQTHKYNKPFLAGALTLLHHHRLKEKDFGLALWPIYSYLIWLNNE